MITEEKINIYQKYEGDIDSWAKGGTKKEKAIMCDEDWYLITSIIQDIYLMKNRLGAFEFNSKIERFLKENCKDQVTMEKIKLLAGKSS
jgi:hypothetical protein